MDIKQTEQPNDDKDYQQEPPVPSLNQSWVSRHSKAITAWTAVGSFVTTAVLATLAYFSWTEVRMQRNLAFKQFVVANAPSVRTYVTTGFQFEGDIGWLVWYIENQGGPVHNVKMNSILLCCGMDELKKTDTTKLVIRSGLYHRLIREERFKMKIIVRDNETIKWLKPFVEGKKPGLYLYVRAEYTIPPELSLDGKEKRDATYRLVGWHPYKNIFEGVKPQYEKFFLRLIEERGYLSIEHQG
jgi:hypothetical protein